MLAIIVAFVLLVVAVWFVVRLANNNDDDTIGDATRNVISLDENALEEDEQSEEPSVTEETSADEQDVNEMVDGSTIEDEVQVDGGEQRNLQDVANEEDAVERADGQVLSTNTDELPNTGGGLGLLAVLPIVLYVGSRRLTRSHRRS